jgi:pentatricopeptide repeat protein
VLYVYVQGLSDAYDRMLASDVPPDACTYSIAFEAIKLSTARHGPSPPGSPTRTDSRGHTKQLALTLLHRWMVDVAELKLAFTPALLTAAITAHGSVGLLQGALGLLEGHFGSLDVASASVHNAAVKPNPIAVAATLKMELSASPGSPPSEPDVTGINGLVPDLRTFNAALTACCKAGRLDLATAVLKKLKACGLSPDIHSYTSLVDGCAAARMPDLARWIVTHMEQQSGVKPSLWTYNALIKVEAFWGSGPAGGMQLVRHLPTVGLTPDTVTWRTVLSAARQRGMDGIVEEAERELSALQPITSGGGEDGERPPAPRWKGFYASDVEEEDDGWW